MTDAAAQRSQPGSAGPTQEQIDVAAAWLEVNEGEDTERAACLAVAEWIKQTAFEKMLRSEARKVGLPVSTLRRKLAQIAAKQAQP